MKLLIEKEKRLLTLTEGEQDLFTCRIALGRQPEGPKLAEGDGRTPEGRYHICLMKEHGKYGRSLGLDYPSVQDGEKALQDGRIDERTMEAIRVAIAEGRRPPWGSPLGGEIYLHEGGCEGDWTQGCIALESSDMDHIWAVHTGITEVEIR